MKEQTSNRPGVMIYFDKVAPFLAKMDDEQAGKFFRAILEYAEFGVIPELDLVGDLAFNVIQPLIDRDAAKYKDTVKKRKYAAYCREAEKEGQKPMSREAWMVYYEESDDIT